MNAVRSRCAISSAVIWCPTNMPIPRRAIPIRSIVSISIHPALDLFRSTVDGLKNRFKLRIRFYDDDPAHPVFLEIKRRLSEVICKERACVRREAVNLLLRGIRPGASLLGVLGRSRARPPRPCRLFTEPACKSTLGPRVYISYQREAYVSPDSDQIRVTFDRQITAARYRSTPYLATPKATMPVDMRGVVLEMKFTDRFPNWMRQMVHALDLWRWPSAKYVAGIRTIGYPWIEGIGRDLGVAS